MEDHEQSFHLPVYSTTGISPLSKHNSSVVGASVISDRERWVVVRGCWAECSCTHLPPSYPEILQYFPPVISVEGPAVFRWCNSNVGLHGF